MMSGSFRVLQLERTVGSGQGGPIYADGPFTVANGREQGERLIRDHADDLPDAVLVAADTLAVAVAGACGQGHSRAARYQGGQHQ